MLKFKNTFSLVFLFLFLTACSTQVKDPNRNYYTPLNEENLVKNENLLAMNTSNSSISTASKDIGSDDFDDDFDDTNYEFDDFDESDEFDEFEDYSIEQTSDPLEVYNRAMFGFNDFFLLDIIKPLHKGYTYIVPEKIRAGFENFANNLFSPIRFLNALLQLDFGGASVEFAKFTVNTLVSLGFADVAQKDRPNFYYNKDAYDFATTLAVWGLPEGPPITLPFFGPHTVRSAIGLVGDTFSNPLSYIAPLTVPITITRIGLSFNEMDKVYIPYEQLKKTSIDSYISVRDVGLELTRGKVEKHIIERNTPYLSNKEQKEIEKTNSIKLEKDLQQRALHFSEKQALHQKYSARDSIFSE